LIVPELSVETWIDFAHALGIGLFVGLEREHSELASEIPAVDAPTEHPETGSATVPMGVRTFALLSLLGWGIGVAGRGAPWLPAVALLVVGAMVMGQYVIARDRGYGLTTEVAAVLTFVMGMMVSSHRELAVALAIVTTLLLISKRWVRSVVQKVRQVELTGALQLAILLAIVLPLLPAEPVDPWDALPPRKIGLFVVLIAGLSYVGYILTRILGRRRGVGLTGLLGGLTSSTAVTVSMAKAGRDESMRQPGQLATFIANATMFARVIVITAVVSLPVAAQVALPMGIMGAVMLGAAAWRWRGLSRSDEAEEAARSTKLKNPFALVPALMWGAVLSIVLLVSVVARDLFGDSGLYAAALVSGFADVDAITLAVSEQSFAGSLDAGVAATSVTLAVMSNTVVKAGMALVGGGLTYAKPIAVTFAITIVAGGVAIALV
jgi:uncharacterized membrane protein (DUF4010 family)